MSECAICGTSENVIDHHVLYQPERTVPVCRGCHWYAHNEKDHELHPLEEKPEEFKRDYSDAGVMINIDDTTRDVLRGLKEGNDTYDDVITRLIDENDALKYMGGELND